MAGQFIKGGYRTYAVLYRYNGGLSIAVEEGDSEAQVVERVRGWAQQVIGVAHNPDFGLKGGCAFKLLAEWDDATVTLTKSGTTSRKRPIGVEVF